VRAGLRDVAKPRGEWSLLLAKLYVEHFDPCQDDVTAVFSGQLRRGSPRQGVAFRRDGQRRIRRISPLVETILNHVHHRAVQCG